MPVGEVALALGCMLGKVFGILEVWILCSFESVKKVIAVDLGACWGRCLEGLAGFGGFGAFGAFGEFWRVCGLANGSFESP